jgi:hypothetical protein
MTRGLNRRYWVWVTGPDYYLDDDGCERRSLEPGELGSWTCHQHTQKGDLVVLYRRPGPLSGHPLPPGGAV